ncbi:Hypothetical Protein FCC1311_090822 [Hondaea fermentalgiana]|uniref:Uncharacterized protein n=1 Tax=Hondaea fermentalgiana TaxID=2315210 RepID=A0A2R5GPR8_9STRA|nr:Hypothetical Protein FCC1311_090822 [Hondaea fermentalgiana]|eukprot:GBG32857.1 Hypothetical Protein FCC1311_090822 [Hondaea fermentalgiana]
MTGSMLGFHDQRCLRLAKALQASLDGLNAVSVTPSSSLDEAPIDMSRLDTPALYYNDLKFLEIEMEANPIVKFDHSILRETAYTQDGINVIGGGSKPWHPATEGYIGWGGFGGNMWTWMPDEEVGFAYLQNGNMLGSLFQRCLRIIKVLSIYLDKKAAAENMAT